MTLSYRYLSSDLAMREALSVQAGVYDIENGLEKSDYHQRAFSKSVIGVDRLIEVREALFTLYGINSGKLAGEAPNSFDSLFTQNVNLIFHDLQSVDGFSKEVWSYINLRVLPDFVLWRWPNNHIERFLGGSERSCFQRLWQRAFVLGPELAGELQEDEAVNIFERPEALGGNRRLAKAMAEFIVKNRVTVDSNTGQKIITTEIVKKSAKRIRRAMSIQLAQTMSPSELERWIAIQFSETFSKVSNSTKD